MTKLTSRAVSSGMRSRKMRPLQFGLAVTSLAVCATAQAHAGHELSGFLAGFAHPWTGFDHVLAMFAVGLWAMQMKNAAFRWALPLTFAASAGLFAVLSWSAVLPAVVMLPLTEPGILASLLVLGALLAFRTGFTMVPALLLTALMGAFHGQAHGVGMSGLPGVWIYAAGLVLATLVLHGLGLLAAHRVLRFGRDWMLRLAGAGVMAGGMVGVAVIAAS